MENINCSKKIKLSKYLPYLYIDTTIKNFYDEDEVIQDNYSITIKNIGRGAALNIKIESTFDNYIISKPVIILHRDIQSLVFKFPIYDTQAIIKYYEKGELDPSKISFKISYQDMEEKKTLYKSYTAESYDKSSGLAR